MSQKEKINGILKALKEHSPDVRCALHHESPFQLLIATILSAQCTDKKVNQVTPKLFEKFPQPADFARANLEDIEFEIRSIGLFRSKAKSLKECSERLVQEFASKVPEKVEDLLSLRGVARKTANVVLGEIYNRPDGVVVDTHVRRITQLMGLTKEEDPKKIEKDLNQLIPRSEWRDFSHRVIHLGREICIARRPQCEHCPVLRFCSRRGLKPLKRPVQRVYSLDRQGGLKALKKSGDSTAAKQRKLR